MIIVFGSMNMDLVFPVAHAPQAGETILIPDYQQFPGGKGANQAAAAALMGSAVMMAACVGTDAFGGYLTGILKDKKIDTSLVQVDAQARTGSAMITLSPDGENRIIVAAGANARARQHVIPDKLLASGHTVLMQMETGIDEIAALASRAQGRVDRVILNLAPMIAPGEATLHAVDMLILNEIEIVQLATALGFTAQQDYQATATMVAEKYDLICIITLGPAGAEAYDAQGIIAQAKALALDHVVDTTGAGDAFCGALAAFLDQGMILEEALRYACVAGSLSCLNQGAMNSYPSKEEVLQHAG